MEPPRHIIGFQPCGVEPLLQSLGLTRMPKRVPEPNAFERGHFVETCGSTRFKCEVRGSPDADVQNVIGFAKIIRDFEPERWCELVVRVKRRHVAIYATLPRWKTTWPWLACSSNLFGFGGGFSEEM
jgi:hypothetical protein